MKLFSTQFTYKELEVVWDMCCRFPSVYNCRARVFESTPSEDSHHEKSDGPPSYFSTLKEHIYISSRQKETEYQTLIKIQSDKRIYKIEVTSGTRTYTHNILNAKNIPIQEVLRVHSYYFLIPILFIQDTKFKIILESAGELDFYVLYRVFPVQQARKINVQLNKYIQRSSNTIDVHPYKIDNERYTKFILTSNCLDFNELLYKKTIKYYIAKALSKI